MRDRDIRQALYAQVLIEHVGDLDTLIVEELGVCGLSRIDVAVINGVLHGYELKSDSDTLERLPTQSRTYSAVFDFVTIVAGQRHRDGLLSIVPEWWGVLEAADSGSGIVLTCARKPMKNPEVDVLSQARLLWRDEALELLERAGAAQGFRGKPREHLYRRLMQVLAPSELSDAVRNRIRSRPHWRVDGQRMLGDDSFRLVAK